MSDTVGEYFCYIDVNSEVDLIIESILGALSILLLGDAARKYWRMRGSHNSTVTIIYMLVFSWWISK
jgi:hypothetical protein